MSYCGLKIKRAGIKTRSFCFAHKFAISMGAMKSCFHRAHFSPLSLRGKTLAPPAVRAQSLAARQATITARCSSTLGSLTTKTSSRENARCIAVALRKPSDPQPAHNIWTTWMTTPSPAQRRELQWVGGVQPRGNVQLGSGSGQSMISPLQSKRLREIQRARSTLC